MSETEVPWLNEREMAVWRRWLRVQTELPAALGRALAQDSELSLQDFETLVVLSEAPDERLRISALADQMDWERSRLSHHLRRMAARGLVAKQDCQEDGRGSFVMLTDEGRAALEAAAPGHVRAVRGIFLEGMTDDELELLGTFLSRVLERASV
ncbi:MarR family winged helix-turn-helix transcriptional regulator [Ornithinimicrobium humiphilum]|uniref:MarR family transcriptional regulator n=1 Tax=Ornithinimicrobium humiphilum TaxID=125288 RepID=A0A543K7M7_9MICO|nr:MarR family transcriptional regulator [Ornithinimicrobium humiphilum]TQM91089.1 MarR family transcriptional regulator [Ornithinimicrobium humiphilum]